MYTFLFDICFSVSNWSEAQADQYTCCAPFNRYFFLKYTVSWAGPRSAVGNVSGYRCVSDCRSRGREFDPGPVQYFRGD